MQLLLEQVNLVLTQQVLFIVLVVDLGLERHDFVWVDGHFLRSILESGLHGRGTSGHWVCHYHIVQANVQHLSTALINYKI